MTKLKAFVAKHDNLFVFLLLILVSAGFIFRNEILGYDGLWVFGNLYKLANGFHIYEDVNIITFPLFYEVFKTLLSLFNNYLWYLMLNFLIITPLYYTIYQIFKICNVKKIVALLFTLLIAFITVRIGFFGPSYNTFALLLYLLGLFLFFKKKDSKYSFIIQGIMAFLVLITHQKLGAAYVGSLLIFHIFSIKTEKKPIINLIKTYSITFISAALFVLVLFLTNKLNVFIDLTLGGMGNFTNNCSFHIAAPFYLSGIFAFFVFTIICIKKKFNNYTALKTLVCFSIPALLIVYPIFNGYHFTLYFTVFFIVVFFTFYNIFVKLFDNKMVDKIFKVFTAIAIIFFIINSIISVVHWGTKCNKTPGDLYFGSVLDKNMQAYTGELSEYIDTLKEQNINYRIVSIHAMIFTLYDVPEKNNSFCDMPLRGNFGKDDWHRIINILNQDPEGTYIIVDKKVDDKFLIYQFPEDIFNYINDNYKHVKDFEVYSVYEK